jgi:hypothetical protein
MTGLLEVLSSPLSSEPRVVQVESCLAHPVLVPFGHGAPTLAEAPRASKEYEDPRDTLDPMMERGM